ncbi:MAG: hypothetical protein WKH64_15825, partial [Chloroflexia bacterium]
MELRLLAGGDPGGDGFEVVAHAVEVSLGGVVLTPSGFVSSVLGLGVAEPAVGRFVDAMILARSLNHVVSFPRRVHLALLVRPDALNRV